MSPKPSRRSSSRLLRRAPSSSAVDSRTVAKRQSWTSSSPRYAPRWVWVFPTSTTSSTTRDYPGSVDHRRIPDICSGAVTYVLHAFPASHPSAAVERALQLKGLPYRRVELIPVAHKVVQRIRFGVTTVPAIEL